MANLDWSQGGRATKRHKNTTKKKILITYFNKFALSSGKTDANEKFHLQIKINVNSQFSRIYYRFFVVWITLLFKASCFPHKWMIYCVVNWAFNPSTCGLNWLLIDAMQFILERNHLILRTINFLIVKLIFYRILFKLYECFVIDTILNHVELKGIP